MLEQLKHGVFVLLNAVYMHPVTNTRIFNIHRSVRR